MPQVSISTRLPVETYQALEKHVKATGQSKAEVIKTALEEYLRKYSPNGKK